MAVATPRADDCGGGWDIVWCGDVRAYVRSPDGQLLQWTVDHTDGQVLRERATTDTERELASQFDHVVTTHLATVTRTSLGSVNVPGPHDHGGHGRLLLTTDGVHKALPPSSIARAASLFRDPQVCAQRLVTAAIRAGSRDNATALVADRVP
jgi:protein phosphatase